MQNEEFIELVKSSISENGLDNIPSDDLIVIYNRAKSIDASNNIQDVELSKAINTLLEEINKRGISPEAKPLEIYTYKNSFLKQRNAGGSSKWVYAIAIPIIVIVIALVINKSFPPEAQKAQALDIVGYYDKHKDFYGDIPLEEVAKDVFYNGEYSKKNPDYNAWKKESGIDVDIEADRRRRNPTFEDKPKDSKPLSLDKSKDFKVSFPFRFDEESIDGHLFRFDRLTRTVEFRRSLGNNKYKWEPKPYYRNLQHVRDHLARIDRDRQIRAIENQTEAMEDIKNTVEDERRDRQFREMNR